jgi:hypothetical protein
MVRYRRYVSVTEDVVIGDAAACVGPELLPTIRRRTTSKPIAPATANKILNVPRVIRYLRHHGPLDAPDTDKTSEMMAAARMLDHQRYASRSFSRKY